MVAVTAAAANSSVVSSPIENINDHQDKSYPLFAVSSHETFGANRDVLTADEV